MQAPSMATLPSQHPPTPPDVDGHQADDDGIGQLLQNNTAGQLQPTSLQMARTPYLPSSTTSYATPEPEFGQWYEDQYGNKSFMLPSQADAGREPKYDIYSPPIYLQNSAYQSHTLPQQQPKYPIPPVLYGTPPPTSDQSTPPRRQTRSRRIAANSGSRHSSPKPKRKAGRGNAKPKTLSKPLSVLTAHMTDIPVKDTAAWVNRSLEERREEAKIAKFVKRPSNSFILYRSAYADRARSFQKSANHQVVSSVAGESWSLESEEVKKEFDQWAKIERENHAKAFPEYKFQPQTNKAPNKKRKDRDGDSEDESDLDSDYTYEPRGGNRGVRQRKTRSPYRDDSHTPSTLDEYDPYGQHGPSMYHSTYRYNNPGKPLPAPLNASLGVGQYYQSTSHPNERFNAYGNGGYVEDLTVRATDGPSSYHQPAPPVIGIPGAYHHELQAGDDSQLFYQLDPMLASYENRQQRLSTGGTQDQGTNVKAEAVPQSSVFGVGLSPVLNDFDSELGGEAVFGGDEWWEQNKDR